ncbi:MAG TPA: DedA family protein [Sulfuricella sp.]|nr:DedA family protein [Sulfuricella sp.]
MEFLLSFVDIVLHLDKYLLVLTQDYGSWVYLILFLIIFCETGLVVAPFLPGDSLLFVAGAMSATGALEVQMLAGLLIAASFLGDNTNYWIGRYAGPRVFSSETSRLLNPVHLEQTHRFYERHGGKAIILARFFPIIRTFAPFVAGVGSMNYHRFLPLSLVGGVAWVGSLVLAGYFFGNIPFLKQNLSLLIFGIIILSMLPGALGYLRHRNNRTRK